MLLLNSIWVKKSSDTSVRDAGNQDDVTRQRCRLACEDRLRRYLWGCLIRDNLLLWFYRNVRSEH